MFLDIHDDTHFEEYFTKNVVSIENAYINGDMITYYVTDDGYWFLDACTIIGDNESGFKGYYKYMTDYVYNNKQRRLNPFFGPNSGYLWENGVLPIDLTGYGREFDMQLYNEMKYEIESKTGIKIVTRTNERDYVRVINDGGCYSWIGRIGGPQELSMGWPGCMTVVSFVHEILHALGIFHTHTRMDRDDHIQIITDNIRPNMLPVFDTLPLEICGCYDCQSGWIFTYILY